MPSLPDAPHPAPSLYIAPDGNDEHAGSREAPFATIEKALEILRESKADDAAPSATRSGTIVFRGGDYFIEKTVQLDDRDSGLVVCAEPGEEPRLYGGTRITGWEKWHGNIYRARVPHGQRFYRLIHNERAATLAQWPKKGQGFGGGFERLTNTRIQIAEAHREADYTDAQVFGFLGPDWFSEMREVLAVDDDCLILDAGGRGGTMDLNDRFYVRGVLEFLSEPGEWCLKHKEGYLYYRPYDDEPLNETAVIVAPTAERVIEIQGRNPADTAHDIRLEGLTLLGSDFSLRWRLFNGYCACSTIPEPLQHGLIYGENVERLTVKGCKLLWAGHSGVFLNNVAQDCVVEDCWIEGAGFCGIYMNSYAAGRGPAPTAEANDINKGHRIANNFLYDCGHFVGAGCGIQFFQSGDNQILHNRIAHMPRYGISYKGVGYRELPDTLYGKAKTFDNHSDVLYTRHNRIAYNDVSNVCRNSFDFGGIEAWCPGRDNLWEFNAVHDIDQTVSWDGWAHALFADDACHHLALRNNLVYEIKGGSSTAVVMCKSIEQVVENNIFADNEVAWVFTNMPYIAPAADQVVRHNIVVGPASRIHGVWARTFQKWEGRPAFKEVDHNIFWPKPTDMESYHELGWETHATIVDPQLARQSEPWNRTYADYVPVADSPAIAAGFKPFDVDGIGLQESFPFDRSEMFRKPAGETIEAEHYDRMRALRTIGGHYVEARRPGPEAWARYDNVDFGEDTLSRWCVTVDWDEGEPLFVQRYDDDLARGVRLLPSAKGDAIPVWEVSPLYRVEGKAGQELLHLPFAPEGDEAVAWKPSLTATTDRGGVTSAPGVVDIDVFHGEDNIDCCAYLRAAMHVAKGCDETKLWVQQTDNARLWINDKEVDLAAPTVALKSGWNTILLKVAQEAAGDRHFKASLGIANNACGSTQVVPGQPTNETLDVNSEAVLELHQGAPNGEPLGIIRHGETDVTIPPLTGRQQLFVLFKQNCRLDRFTFAVDAAGETGGCPVLK